MDITIIMKLSRANVMFQEQPLELKLFLLNLLNQRQAFSIGIAHWTSMAAGCVSKNVYKCINGPVSPKKAEDIVLLRQQDIPEAFMETPGYRQA